MIYNEEAELAVLGAAILEKKVQALLSRVALLLQQAQATRGAEGAAAQAAREVAVLQRLIGASISALKMPEEDIEMPAGVSV